MIGKIAKFGSLFAGCLEYVVNSKDTGKKKTRGELIFHQNLFCLNRSIPEDVSVSDIALEFNAVLDFNSRIEKPVLHQSFSFTPGEKLDNIQLTLIAMEFAIKFNLQDNQMVVYKHIDKAHEHIHIIANRLDLGGVNTYYSSNNYYETGDFSRKMETMFGLKPTAPMHSAKLDGKLNVKTDNQLHHQIRGLIDELLPNCSSIEDLQIALLQKGWKSYANRGISFIHHVSGTKLKGSELGRAYSLANIEKRLVGSYQKSINVANESESLRSFIRSAAFKSSSFMSFESAMKDFGYNVIYREVNQDGKVAQDFIGFSKKFSESATKAKYISVVSLGIDFSYKNIMRNILYVGTEWQSMGFSDSEIVN